MHPLLGVAVRSGCRHAIMGVLTVGVGNILMVGLDALDAMDALDALDAMDTTDVVGSGDATTQSCDYSADDRYGSANGPHFGDTADTGNTGNVERADEVHFTGDNDSPNEQTKSDTTTDPSTDNSNDPSVDNKSSPEQRSPNGLEGIYQQGRDTWGNPVAQGSYGGPYNPQTGAPVNPIDVRWPSAITGKL
ncbi:hypothetical protein BJX68DRAFT_249611 [Aspergillus pseudodeflectus]|uniref:Uncharacterized protein n=1 Tax=Aspergillus pseudodeflectus TaxID=176178 RepID=A0ABR4JC99_9EURO